MVSQQMQQPVNIYQIYADNEYRFGFLVRRTDWKPGRYATVVGIEFVDKHYETIPSPRYFVTLQAEWLVGGIVEIDSGDNSCWERIYANSTWVA